LKDVRHKGKIIKLQLWDTAGQEKFRSVTSSYYRGAHGALVCFTTDRDPSFLSLAYWLDEIRDNAPVNFQVVLVAVSSGSEDTDFNVEAARQFAREKQLTLMTCEMDDKVKVQQVFQTVVERIMGSLESENMAVESVRLHDYADSSSRNSGCLC
jgi:small GTP-binding protein